MFHARLSVLRWILLLLALAPAAHSAAPSAERPNILVILADDLGYGDLGFTGSPDIQTPVLDRLAAGGVVFDNGYVTHPFCGPSRAGLITGRHQARFGVDMNFINSPFDTHNGLPVEERTFAERLKPAGYRTGIVGKWHLGSSHVFHPNHRGFDFFFGFLSGGHTYLPHKVTVAAPLVNDAGKPNYTANEGSLWPLSRNTREAVHDEYLTTQLSREAAGFVRGGADDDPDAPFCLYLAYNAPHMPLEAPKELIDKYSAIPNKRRRTYAAMIDAMDQGIGMVVAVLEETGQLDNTLIFFLSDNGGVAPRKPGDNYDYASNLPFRGGKGGTLEGGNHVPFIAHWPAALPAGTRYAPPVSALDIAATAVALGGGNTDGPPLEGKNLVPHVLGEDDSAPHAALFWRMDDGAAWAVRTPEAKYLKHAGNTELYDLTADPYEANDLLGDRPELRQELAVLWNDWNADNQPNRFMAPDAYLNARLDFYRGLREQLDADAADATPHTID